jgi:hypothetical protein
MTPLSTNMQPENVDARDKRGHDAAASARTNKAKRK